MLADVLRFLSIYLILLFVIYISGFFVLKSFRKKFIVPGFYTGLFLSFLLGLITLVFIFSIVKTHFLTVCIFFPVVFFLSFYGKKIALSSVDAIEGKNNKLSFYLVNTLLVLLPFIYFSFVLFKNGSFHFNAVAYDNATYSELSVYLAETGFENKWCMFFSDLSSVKGVEPYHYVDSWLNAITCSVFGSNALQSFYLVTYPLLITIILSGILAIVEHFKKIRILELTLAVLLLFIGPVYGIKNLNYHFNSIGCEIPLQHFGEKFAIYYPFILLSILLILNNYVKESVLWLLSLCIVSSTVLPAMVLFSFFLLLISGKNKKHLLVRISLFFILYIGFFVLFSSGKNSSGNSNNMLGFTDLETYEFSSRWFKLSLSNFAYGFGTSLKYFFADYFYMLPLFFYVIFFKKDISINKPLLALTLLSFFGLTVACIFYKLPDSYQLFTNTLPLLHCIVITFVIFALYKNSANKIIILTTWLFVVLLCSNTLYCSLNEYAELNRKAAVSDSYMEQVKTLIIKDKRRQKIGFIYNQADHDNLFLHPDLNYLYHLSYLSLNAVPLRLSIMDVNDSILSPVARKAYSVLDQHELFYTFCLNKHYTPQNSDSLKIRFIKNYHLNYLLIGPTTIIPNYLTVGNSTIITDPKTHLRFIRLNNF